MKTDYAFPVGLQNIKTEDNVQIPHRFAVVRGDTNKPIGIVSDKYFLLPHDDVVKGFRTALKGRESDEVIKIGKNGARLFMDITLPDVKVNVGRGDDIALKLIVENSYDGSKMLQVTFGAFRLVCSNGMIIGRKFVNLSQRHVGENMGLKVDLIQTQIEVMTKKFRETAPVMKRMTETSLVASPTEYFEGIGIPNYLARIAVEEYEKGKDKSLWGAYNASTAAITHHMKKESPRASISYGKKAWSAAVSFTK